MNKQRASGRKDGYACISGLADICERPHYEHGEIFAQNAQKRSGMRMCGAITNHCVVCESSQMSEKTDMRAYPSLCPPARCLSMLVVMSMDRQTHM